MPMGADARDPGSIVRFGEFELDVRAGELRRAGVHLKLQEQPYRVLLALAENAGRLVTRDELRDRLWAKDTFVDFDHSLNIAVAKIRDVLGDSPTHPRFIETIPRRGYRFLAAVQTVEEDPDAAVPIESQRVVRIGRRPANPRRDGRNPQGQDRAA